MYMCITETLCCIPEANTILLINYPSIKKKKGDFSGGPVAKTPCSQWRGLVLIPDQGAESPMPQLKDSHMLQRGWKFPCATTKTQCSQINNNQKKEAAAMA